MPKRLLDDSYLSSPSLAKCSPRAQDAFPRFILLADDFGCFEVIPRALVGKGWPKRDDVTEHDIETWLNEYVAAGMACIYTALERRCCYLTGWNGPHGQKKRAEYDPNAPAGTPGRHGSRRKLPAPPDDLVAAVVSGARRDTDGKPPGTDRELPGEKPNDSTPARETSGSREIPAAFPAVPGPVVPDVVPVADPDAAATGGPGKTAAAPDDYPPRRLEVVDASGPHLSPDPWPLTDRFRHALADALARTAPHPVGGGEDVLTSCERALERLGVEDAVRVAATRVREAVARREPQPRSLKLIVAILGDELTRRASQPRAPPKCIGMDDNGQPVWEAR